MPASRPPARRVLDNARGVSDAGEHGRYVPCIYCREQIQAESFTFWSSTRRLMSATCPTCSRRVTLTAATWRRWPAVPAHAAR
jgi:hypothetical protein